MKKSTTLISRILTKHPELINRQFKDLLFGRIFLSFRFFPALLIICMIAVLLFRTSPILKTHSVWELITGLNWLPMQGKFGYFPFITGTLWVTTLAMIFALPPGLLTAIYLSEYAHPTLRRLMKPLLDILAGIPSVVYGVWGMLVVVPMIRFTLAPVAQKWLDFIPIFKVNNMTGFSILAGGIVLAIMVSPIVISVFFEVMEAVPNGLREASLALGSTRLQMIQSVVLRKSAPGILAGCILGFSRAFGETMAVLMVVGNVPRVPSSLFDPAYPLTALIANNYGEMLSIPLYDAGLMGAAFVLLIIILIFNIIAAGFLHRTLKGSG